ncbi:M20/M25/M40 family metallo-hydrolase [Croceiramulus getboli]|nr:M20/M25/M40 family metallo-hydrolase [Flavobacteriaceae bacterium YJPT1-3]
MKKAMHKIIFAIFSCWVASLSAQSMDDAAFREMVTLHREFVSIPNLPADPERMLDNIRWVQEKYEGLEFETSLLTSETLPILLVEKVYNPELKTILFYFHIDGQPVNPAAWNQINPFTPVLKAQQSDGSWQEIAWSELEGTLDDDWRMFARAAADDKAPILMLYTALQQLQQQQITPNFNIKILFDPEEEYSSKALLGTLDEYKDRYTSDYFIVMDGPAHPSNAPTLTFGCRGIATCSITTYGPNLPQHSGHYGNYAPNPVFRLANLLSSMKNEEGEVLIKDYYREVKLNPAELKILNAVPYDAEATRNQLGIAKEEQVGRNYQEALQYPSLNVRQLETSWKGEGLKTIIPETATAHFDIRLVPEIDGEEQLKRIRQHLEQQGYLVLDREPTGEERLTHDQILTFQGDFKYNAYRTATDSEFGKRIRRTLEDTFEEEPVIIRMMGGTVPIVPLIQALNVPTVIVPMVNMDNNQHNPNENIRLGNLRQGVAICKALLQMKLQ